MARYTVSWNRESREVMLNYFDMDCESQEEKDELLEALKKGTLEDEWDCFYKNDFLYCITPSQPINISVKEHTDD